MFKRRGCLASWKQAVVPVTGNKTHANLNTSTSSISTCPSEADPPKEEKSAAAQRTGKKKHHTHISAPVALPISPTTSFCPVHLN